MVQAPVSAGNKFEILRSCKNREAFSLKDHRILNKSKAPKFPKWKCSGIPDPKLFSKRGYEDPDTRFLNPFKPVKSGYLGPPHQLTKVKNGGIIRPTTFTRNGEEQISRMRPFKRSTYEFSALLYQFKIGNKSTKSILKDIILLNYLYNDNSKDFFNICMRSLKRVQSDAKYARRLSLGIG